MSTILNLGSVKNNSSDGDYDPISDGRYDLLIEKGEEKTSKSGNPMLEFTMKVEGPKFKNRKVWANFSLLDNALIYLIRFLEAAGKEAVIKDGVQAADIINAAVGSKVSGYISIRNTQNGKPTNRVENFQPSSGGGSGGAASSSSGSSGDSGTKKKLFG